jgi:Ig-fold domain
MFHMLDGPPKDGEVFLVSVKDVGGDVLIDEYVVLGNVPKNLRLSTNVTISVLSIKADEMGDAIITLQSDGVALYVVLTTLAEGSFDDNAFLLKPTTSPKVRSFDRQAFVHCGYSLFQSNCSMQCAQVIKFTSRIGQVDFSLLQQSLRIEHLASSWYAEMEEKAIL